MEPPYDDHIAAMLSNIETGNQKTKNNRIYHTSCFDSAGGAILRRLAGLGFVENLQLICAAAADRS